MAAGYEPVSDECRVATRPDGVAETNGARRTSDRQAPDCTSNLGGATIADYLACTLDMMDAITSEALPNAASQFPIR
jgi:hypothetical protein